MQNIYYVGRVYTCCMHSVATPTHAHIKLYSANFNAANFAENNFSLSIVVGHHYDTPLDAILWKKIVDK